MDPHLPIKLKQIQMSEKYKNKMPSRCKKISWIYAINQMNNYHSDTIRSGKYLLFVGTDNIDLIWSQIKEATINGLLGDSSKVSTYLQRKQKHSQQYVICIYTYDCDDLIDLQRIENNLNYLGFNHLPYKTNKETLNLK